jgi:hypothetical protein
MNNAERAEHAAAAMKAYLASKGEATHQPCEDHDIADLVCDLLHYADTFGFNIDLLLQRAQDHHECEKSDEAAA